jgi:peptide/nickel transport system permease protein
VIGRKAQNTFILATVTLGLLIPIALLLGIVSAVKADSPIDHGIGVVTLSFIATPDFVVGTTLAVLLGTWLGWVSPVSLIDPSRSVFGQLPALVLPVLTLLAATAAQTVRMVRTCFIEVLSTEYVQMARLKGVPNRRVLLHHALPNALGPIIQVLAFNTVWLLGGVVVVENVFQYPGLGTTLVTGVTTRDLATVEALALIIGAVFVVTNTAADLTVDWLNPRVRRSI